MNLIDQGPATTTPNDGVLLDLKVDPHAGSWVGKEVAMGGALLFATDAVCVLTGAGIAWAATSIFSSGSTEAVVVTLVGGGLILLIDLVTAPLVAAIGAYGMAEKEGNNGLLGAALGAYAAQAIGIVAGVAMYFAVEFVAFALVASPGGVFSPNTEIGITIAGLVSLVVAAVLRYVGVPMGASFGIHWAGAINRQPPADSRPRRSDPIASPGRTVLTVPLVAFRF